MFGTSRVDTRGLHLAFLLGAMLSVTVLGAGRLEAQYFGRNKVVYRDFDWRTMHTEHYDIYFYPAESAAVADAARMAERWYARHSLTLRDTFSKKPIVLYADNPAFQQTNVIPGFLGEGIGGVTEPSRSRALLFFSGAYFDDDHVLGHELVHVFQFDIAGAARGGLNNLDRLPQWSIEGMAEYLSLGRDDPNTTMFMRDAALRNDLPTIKKLNNPKYFAYRYGEALWAFIGGRFGDSTIATIYRAALRSGLEPAVRGVLGITTDSLSKLWIAAIKEQYLADAKTRTLPKDLGTRLLRPASKYGDFDVAPSISPDGKEVAFITSRDLFSFDLYIADAATGRTIRRLTSPNSNPHFDALSFSNSSGSWSPDGKYLAVPAYAQGVVDVEIFNTRNGNIEQHIAPPGVGQVLSIAWSPDGKQLAFSGLSGGWSDLYLYDLGAKRTIQLMHDRAAQFQPAWSPDGRTLAFATDSGPGTSFSLLTYRPLQIALMDMTNPDHPVRMLSLFGGKAKHINPQFTPDGQSLYFVSDPDGIPDIYRVALATGTIQRVTRVATGITGITGSSPTLSVAPGNGRMIFSVFDRQGYTLHRLDADQVATPTVSQVVDTSSTQGIETPPVPGGGAVAERIADPRLGLPLQREFAVTPYHSSFQLDGIATAGVGVAFGGPLGTGAGGGVAFQFGDELENHILAATVQASGYVQDIGGQAVYLNQAHRWNYGVSASHIPFLQLGTAAYDTTIVNPDGSKTPGAVLQEEYLRTYYEQAQLFAQYPFSMTRRLEFSGGYTYLHYGLRADRYLELPDGSIFALQQQVGLPVPSGLNLFQASAAYVTDYSNFGFTSPVAGGRSRFEADETFGNLMFTSVLADYRRYFLANPITFAFRAFHYGRYGGSAEDPRLSPLYLGDPYFIRGYDISTFNANECSALFTGAGTCPTFDRLLGSRLAVLNAEVRIPLLGVPQFGLINFPYLPTEIAPFVDAGLAWSSTSHPVLTFNGNDPRDTPVVSAGVAARFNVLGYIVAEVFYARAFQRPANPNQFGFQILPGW